MFYYKNYYHAKKSADRYKILLTTLSLLVSLCVSKSSTYFTDYKTIIYVFSMTS